MGKRNLDTDDQNEDGSRKKKRSDVTDDDAEVPVTSKTLREKKKKAEAAIDHEIQDECNQKHPAEKKKKRATAIEESGKHKKMKEAEEEEAKPKKAKKEDAPAGKAAKQSKKAEVEVAPTDSRSNQKLDKSKVQVKGLPKTATRKEISEHFSSCGTVSDVNVLLRPNGRSCGVAFVTFEDKKAGKAAVKLDCTEFQAQEIKVAFAKKATEAQQDKGRRGFEVFVGGLPYDVDETTAWEDFESMCGEVSAVNLPYGPNNKPKGFAFITFKAQAALEKALQLHETEYRGRWLMVKYASQSKSTSTKMDNEDGTAAQDHKNDKGKGKGKGKGKEKGGTRECEVFVGGLSFHAEEHMVRKDFEECGEICRFSMPKHTDGPHEGKHKGLAFINYSSKEAMKKALAHHQTEYYGVLIRVLRADAPRNFQVR